MLQLKTLQEMQPGICFVATFLRPFTVFTAERQQAKQRRIRIGVGTEMFFLKDCE